MAETPEKTNLKFLIPDNEALQIKCQNSIHDSNYAYTRCLRHLNIVKENYLKPFKAKADTFNLYHVTDLKTEEKHMTQYYQKTIILINTSAWLLNRELSAKNRGNSELAKQLLNNLDTHQSEMENSVNAIQENH